MLAKTDKFLELDYTMNICNDEDDTYKSQYYIFQNIDAAKEFANRILNDDNEIIYAGHRSWLVTSLLSICFFILSTWSKEAEAVLEKFMQNNVYVVIYL